MALNIVIFSQGYSNFLGGRFREIVRELKGLMPHDEFIREQDFDGKSQVCVDMLNDLIPHAVGYVYVKGIEERDVVKADVALQANLTIESFLEMIDTLDWITPQSKNASITKSKYN